MPIDLFHIAIDVLGLVMSLMILPGVYCKQVEQPLQLAGVRCGVGLCGATLLRAMLKSLNFSPFSLIGGLKSVPNKPQIVYWVLRYYLGVSCSDLRPPINEKGEKLRDFNIARNSVAPHNPTPHLTPAN